MGQSLDSMTQNQSKDELLYQFVHTADVEAIKALCREGANLEWINKEGKTPLIMACLHSGLFNVAKTLIEMGANINAYRPGRHAGTPLHHAAKRGLEETVKLLLSSGANVLVRNDDCQTALDVARIKGHTNIVRIIEDHICYFSGWLREFYGPGFLEALAPQLLSRKIWSVVIPCGSANPTKPVRLELAIYPTLQDAQPRTVIALWKAKIEEPKLHQADPGVIIFDQSTKTRYKFASGGDGDRQQLQQLYDACRGIPQSSGTLVANGWGNSMPGDSHNGWGTGISPDAERSAASTGGWLDETPKEKPVVSAASTSGWMDDTPKEQPVVSAASTSGWMDETPKEEHNGWGLPLVRPSDKQEHGQINDNNPPTVGTSCQVTPSAPSAPSAPPLPDEGPILYPSIDFGPIDLTFPSIDYGNSSTTADADDTASSSLCIICWEAPVECACIPCGHMAGCMACLSEINAKKGVCPVCRAKITQVIRLYAV